MYKNVILQTFQWLLIIALGIGCLYFWRLSKENQKPFIENTKYDKSDTEFVDITNDMTIEELQKLNKEFFDSIKRITDIKEALYIKYMYQYKSDTVDMKNNYLDKDSLYHYSHKSDTINYDLSIKGKSVEWFTLDFSLRDSLMIVTRSKNGQNETTITHNKNTKITDVTVFVPKKNFLEKIKERTYFGFGVSAGYGVLTKKPDMVIGINAGIKF